MSYQHIGALPPLPTEFSQFCETNFFGKKEKHTKNGENHMKEQKESFRTVYGLPK
jgi:hypothetical protein